MSKYELHGVYEAVSISSESANDPDGTRSLTMMERRGGPDDPYGGWAQADSLHDVRVSEVPDGRDLSPADHPAFGYDDDEVYAVFVRGDTVTVAYGGKPARQKRL